MSVHAYIMNGDKIVGHICGSDNALLAIGTVEPRWCPRCRGRYLHRWEVRGDREPSYWEPVGVWTCRVCRGWEKLATVSQTYAQVDDNEQGGLA